MVHADLSHLFNPGRCAIGGSMDIPDDVIRAGKMSCLQGPMGTRKFHGWRNQVWRRLPSLPRSVILGRTRSCGLTWGTSTGDPLRYHSHFVASVIESPKAPLTPMEIVAHGRLGTATKKSHLFCEWDESRQEVTYYSVEWAGFG